ncbi:MAG: cytosine deaminase [Opitutus sp.]
MLLVRRARVPIALLPASLAPVEIDPLEPAMLCDITIDGGRIASVHPTSVEADGLPRAGDSRPELDAAGRLVFPGFIDAHVHLDKTHTWHRAPNRSGTFLEALQTLGRDKDNWSEADLLRRADFALRCAWAHGTRAIRTHVDTGLPWAETSHAVMATLRDNWHGRITLQTVPLCGGDAYASADGEALADLALRYGASALGGFLIMSDTLPRQIDRLLAIARERGVGIDLHVDENGNPAAECLRLVAEAVIRNAFPHPVVCGHCCSLSVQSTRRAKSTIALVREAGISVICLPLCNVYLQDRRSAQTGFPRSPYWRGLTMVHDLLDAGVKVACASDNVRDAFYAFGDYDMAEVYTESIRLAHLDAGLAASVRVVTSTPADLMGLNHLGRIAPGSSAHLVLFPEQRFSELLSRPRGERTCIDGEDITSPDVPDYAELDGKFR